MSHNERTRTRRRRHLVDRPCRPAHRRGVVVAASAGQSALQGIENGQIRQKSAC